MESVLIFEVDLDPWPGSWWIGPIWWEVDDDA